MLAKVPAKRNDGRSSFKSLQMYMEARDVLDPETGEVKEWLRDGVPVETNCLDRETAWREMLAVADMNARVKDPVYHVVLSWREGEHPTDEQMFEACRAAMKAVNMEDHQYVAAIHRDTDNWHVHLMINRVHPETYRAVYPDRDWYNLDRCMREVELAQGWSHDNGPFAVHYRDGRKVVDWAHETPEQHRQAQRERGPKLPTKAKDMELATGNESFARYAQDSAKREALATLKQPGATWEDLHRTLAKHGIELRPTSDKKNAFRAHSTADPSVSIKASMMELGGGKLVKQLGPWQEPKPEMRREQAEREYSKHRPKRDPAMREQRRDERAAERQGLRDGYKAYSDEWKASKAPARAAMYADQKKRQKALTEKHKAQREHIRKSGLSAVEKRAFYSEAARDTAEKRQQLNDAIKTEREAFRTERPQGFRDWVADRAAEGDRAAMRQVRGWAYQDKRTAKAMQQADALAERGAYLSTADAERREPDAPRRIMERMTWSVDRTTGAVDYKVNDRVAFRDSGRRLDYTQDGQKDQDAIEAGLLLGKEKFGGKPLRVTGPDEFRERVLQTAVERRLDVRFSDPELERRRQEGLRQQAERGRPDWSKFRELAGSGGRGAQQPSPPRPVAEQPPHPAPHARPEQPTMTAEEARQVLARGVPEWPVRDVVELDAIQGHAAAYRQQLDRQFREQHGERPDPQQAGGWIARHMAAGRAEQWDKGRAQIERQVQQRIEYLNGDAPEARQFRDAAWTRATERHAAELEQWKRAQRVVAPQLQDLPPMPGADGAQSKPEARPQREQELRQQQERQKREAEAQRLAERQRQQAAERERQKQQGRDRDDDIDYTP